MADSSARAARSAFAPAHVSGLFAIHDEADDPLRKGSRGVGWCLQRGAYATVRHADDVAGSGDPGEGGPPERGQTGTPGRMAASAYAGVRVDGEPVHAVVTQAALSALAPDAGLAVDLRLELPVGQGFGMSAAGTLAACLAATDLLGLEPEAALEATHRAEVEHGTGLGDAIGSWFGSGEIRLKPGCPPHGWAMQVQAPEETEFLFCIMGDPIDTSGAIHNPELKVATRAMGDEAVDRIVDVGRDGAWTRLLAESQHFGRMLGLMPERMDQVGRTLPKGILWGQCMIGSAMWVHGSVGELERAEALLEPEGETFRCGVDPNGARLVRQVPSVGGVPGGPLRP